ncbi:SWIM zinc finger family protein [Calidifontibacillus erzurumensis]|uniref:SWIM zinc finger family protein n=1 Tax=Calidifontibacillus erzurumensis TaxID=2741433 RepID=UPI0035B50537
MKLINFEEYIDDVILDRGKDYYDYGHVEKITEVNDNHFLIEVSGSDNYIVEVFIDDSGEIVDTSCDCPYDWGEYCKHQAAAFYALNEKNEEIIKPTIKKTSSKKNKIDIKEIVSNLSKDELIQIVLNITSEYEEIERELLFKYAPSEDEVSSSKKLIREFINKYKYRGFIEWNDVYDALKGAEMTLSKARQKVKMNEVESAVHLCLAVLSIVVEALEYCDDSSGYVGSVIDESLRIIDEAVVNGIDQLNESTQKKLYDSIVKEALHRRYDGWTEWRKSLLETCTYFCGITDIRNKLENQLHKMLNNISDRSWNAEYERNHLNLLLLKIIELFDEEEKAITFINERIQHSTFREKAILRLMDKGDYNKVISLCNEGEKLNAKNYGLVWKWKKYKLQAYERLGNVEKQRKLMLEFLFNNEFSYYAKLKELTNPYEWERVLQDILIHFEKQPYIKSAYLEILLEEKMYGKLLEYCKRNISSIEIYYQYLLDDYFEEVNGIFKQYIESIAEQASDRKKYKSVCKVIKTYKKVFGDIQGQAIISHLKQKYKRRPAFVDELGKIK